jgi:hypothetical protein
MNKKPVKLIVLFILLFVVSCNDPETIVTNYVHPDGSVTRKIEMRSLEQDKQKRFKISDIQVPVDGSWNFRDSCEVDKKGDTTFVRRGEKIFKNINEINAAYASDSGCNRIFSRKASFKKSFKWFNTEYRFSEGFEKILLSGYPVKDFLNNDELNYYYSPEVLQNNNLESPDSLKYKSLRDSVKVKTDKWITKNMVSEWISEFSNLASGKPGFDMNMKSLKSREDEFAALLLKADKSLDSLWKNGILLSEFIGSANALKYKTEADSAFSIVTTRMFPDFRNYSIGIVMPGKLISANGFIDSTKKMTWPVISDYFMTEPYVMWAESKVPNTWAWIVSGVFLLFVLSGVVIRLIKKD